MATATTTTAPEVSVLVPLGPRHGDLAAICRALREVLTPCVRGYEVVLIDDGAQGGAREALRQVAATHPEVRLLRLPRRMGESTVLAAGASAARGEILIVLDPYLHVSVADLPKLLQPVREGQDLVCAWRHPRAEQGLGPLASDWFNATARWLTKAPVHDLNCRTRVMRRQVLEDIPLYGDLHRFLPILAGRRGFRWCEVPVPQQPGKHEVGAFSPASYARRFLDLLTLVFLTRFMKRPLHFFGLIGGTSLLAGTGICVYLSYIKLVIGEGIGHRPLLLLGVLLIVVGLQVASIGLLGELLIFTHARDLKDYVVEEDLRTQ